MASTLNEAGTLRGIASLSEVTSLSAAIVLREPAVLSQATLLSNAPVPVPIEDNYLGILTQGGSLTQCVLELGYIIK